MQTVLLAVKDTEEVIQTSEGGIRYVTSNMLTGAGATVATTDNIILQDTDGTLFYKRIADTSPPTSTYWTLIGDTVYTITGTPVPYTVSTTNIAGSVEITNDSGASIPAELTAGSALVGKFGIDQTTGQNLVNLKVKAETFAPTYAEGAYNELSQNLGGYLRVIAVGASADNVDANAVSTSGHLPTTSHGYFFNGTTWDRLRGDIAYGLDVDVTRLPALPVGTNSIGAVTNLGIGDIADVQATNSTSSWSLVALAKGLFTKLVTLIATQYLDYVTSQVVSFDTSTQSAAVNANTKRVVLSCTTACWVAVGSTPTATINAGSFYLAAGAISFPILVTGGTTKFAAIKDTIAGKLSILESL